MALGLEKQQGSARKRKRKIIRRKFCLEDKVEVRSEDEGFLGSWHSGTIIACQTRGCKVKYSVKYDHMLADDGSGHLVDCVCVSLPVDDVDGANENWCNHRGKIRPLPPMIEFGPYNLPYGMCVDVNYKEAWWEGVIFDYEDDLEERKVFFPDLGDEMMIHVETLRITQDWNEVAETWKPRGTWLLLELIEKHAQSTYMPVSVRQIWYDLREKEGFQKLGEWTSSGEALWEPLLLEAIGDSHKVFLRHLSGVIDLWEAAQQQSKAANDDFMYPVADLAETHFLVPAENMSQNSTLLYLSSNCQSIQQAFDVEQLISLSPSDPQKSNLLTECNRFIFQPQALAVLDSSLNGIPYVTNGGEICHSYSKKNKRKNSSSRCGKTVWQPAGQGVVSGAEFSPDAIIQYTQQGVKQDDSLRIKVRNHLLHQKWKIEFMRDGTMRRIRYTSPEGQIYHSLIQVCLDLRQNDSKSLYLISGDKEESAHSTDSHSLPLVIGLPAVNPEVCRSQLVDSSQFDEVAVEPEYCPQAIEDWYTFGYKERLKGNTKRADLHQMTLRAKKHLLSVGWKFWYTTCSRGKVELRYGSPRGKCYISLRLACKDAMDAGDTTVSKMVEEESASGKVSSPSSKMGIQIRYNYSTASFMSHFRKPVQLLKTNVQANRKVWKTRNGCHQTKGNLDAQNFNMPGFGSRRNGSLSRGLISRRVNKNSTQTTRVLRSKKRVQQAVTSNLSHRKPRNLLSWLIENNVLLPRAKVRYRRQKDGLPIAEGRITRDGIKCSCCRKVFTLSGFEVHAGGKNHRPAVCIFLEDGRSLLDCQKEMMRNFKAGPSSKSKGSWHQGKNDHICSVCHYGGELILCDECPSSFHKSCLGMENVPDGDWFCPSCCCKICGQNKLEKGTGHPMHDGLVSCVQCEHKYHSGCVGTRADKSECLPTESWFCSKNCEAIFLGLHELLGKPIPVGVDNLTWTLLKSEQPDDTKLAATDIEILAESHSKLNIALDVIHECFEPIEEPHTGRDVVKDVIFCQGSELNRLNFQGFYTVLLEKHDEIITVATVRIYGAKVAEMPLVGTRFQYRRLGMCRILMNVLEKRLVELGVQRLVLPAVPSVLDTWTRSFGFTKMTDSERLNFVDCTFLDFQDTVMCHKILTKIPSAEPEMQLILHDGVCGSGEYIDLDGSSAVSEVFQADHVHDAGNVKQGLMDIAAADCSVGGKDPVHSVITVNRPTPAVCEHRVSDIILECLVKDSASGKERNADCIASTTYNKESRFHGIDGLKCYKRRKIVAC